MKKFRWVVHNPLQGAVQVGEGLCAGAESHVLAEIVPWPVRHLRSILGGVCTEFTGLAADANFEGHSLPNVQTRSLRIRSESGNKAASFVTKDEG